MKKLLALVLTLTMLLTPITTLAATNNESKSTVLTLEANSITDVGNRHIKITWEKVDGANNYQMEIADNENFENATSKLSKNRTYWNFAEVPGGVKDTYFVRVRPRFLNDSETDDKYVYGQWSNVVVAAIEKYEPKPIEPEVLENINWFPWIPKGIDWSKLMRVDWNKVLNGQY